VPSVLVVGDVITDVAVRLAEPIAWGTDTRSTIQVAAGGSAANVAAWLAVAGATVIFVGRVGNDVFAEYHRRELSRWGVETRFSVDPALPTGSIVVLVGAEGERTMLTDRGANLRLAPSDLPTQLFQRQDALYVTGYSLFEPAVRETALHALTEARRAHLRVALDPSAHPLLAEVGPEQFMAWTAGADYLFPNRAEAAALTGLGEPGEMGQALARRYGEVALTLGPAGAGWFRKGEEPVAVPARPARVVDTTGAGDAFAAGFLAARLSGNTPAESLSAGISLATRVVEQVGARPSASTDTLRRHAP
jgi:sugar/nucleoside kinase (ribokinase family)